MAKPKASALIHSNDKAELKIGGEVIRRGERKRILLDAAALYDYTSMNIPIEVIRGNKPGPSMFICAAIHGDEVNGVEIIKRLLVKPILRQIKGSLIVIPIVNVFGFNNLSRYLPDRRDLNRSFPGSREGALASRLASIFMKEVVRKCSYGIDLHTGAIHRTNLPQIRASLDEPKTTELAHSFGVPVVIHSKLRDGSLREAARKKGVSMLVYEGGEALRFNEDAITTGVKGCLAVMRNIGMLSAKPSVANKGRQTFTAKSSFWIRAPHSGTFRQLKKLGDRVAPQEKLAVISNPFGKEPFDVVSEEEGIIVGLSTLPLVNRGDAMFHIASFKNLNRVSEIIDSSDE